MKTPNFPGPAHVCLANFLALIFKYSLLKHKGAPIDALTMSERILDLLGEQSKSLFTPREEVIVNGINLELSQWIDELRRLTSKPINIVVDWDSIVKDTNRLTILNNIYTTKSTPAPTNPDAEPIPQRTSPFKIFSRGLGAAARDPKIKVMLHKLVNSCLLVNDQSKEENKNGKIGFRDGILIMTYHIAQHSTPPISDSMLTSEVIKIINANSASRAEFTSQEMVIINRIKGQIIPRYLNDSKSRTGKLLPIEIDWDSIQDEPKRTQALNNIINGDATPFNFISQALGTICSIEDGNQSRQLVYKYVQHIILHNVVGGIIGQGILLEIKDGALVLTYPIAEYTTPPLTIGEMTTRILEIIKQKNKSEQEKNKPPPSTPISQTPVPSIQISEEVNNAK